MKISKIIISAVLLVVMCFAFVGCYEQGDEEKYTDKQMEQAYNSVGFPDTSNYFERQQLKEIYELRDDPDLICYWYTKNDMTGKWIYQGKCIGYGIPYTTSMTSPDMVKKIYSEHYEVISQAEPNGLYASASTSATWILNTDSKGNVKPIYVESEISVSQDKLDKRLCEDWSIPSDY